MESNDVVRWRAAVARNLGSTRFIRNVDVVARVESEDDIAFWQSAIHKARPNVKIKFLPCVMDTDGQTRMRGKSICMKYIDTLNDHFMICVDSDFDNFVNPGTLSVDKHILQTYTYSFENHHCYDAHLQGVWNGVQVLEFSFEVFLKKLSNILYPALISMLAAKSVRVKGWKLEELCGEILSVQFNRKSSLENDGEQVLEYISDKVKLWMDKQVGLETEQNVRMEAFVNSLGMNADNCYLYMQGHCMYDLIERIGRALCNGKLDFRYQVLDSALQLSGYVEADKLLKDIQTLIH